MVLSVGTYKNSLRITLGIPFHPFHPWRKNEFLAGMGSPAVSENWIIKIWGAEIKIGMRFVSSWRRLRLPAPTLWAACVAKKLPMKILKKYGKWVRRPKNRNLRPAWSSHADPSVEVAMGGERLQSLWSLQCAQAGPWSQSVRVDATGRVWFGAARSDSNAPFSMNENRETLRIRLYVEVFQCAEFLGMLFRMETLIMIRIREFPSKLKQTHPLKHLACSWDPYCKLTSLTCIAGRKQKKWLRRAAKMFNLCRKPFFIHIVLHIFIHHKNHFGTHTRLKESKFVHIN